MIMASAVGAIVAAAAFAVAIVSARELWANPAPAAARAAALQKFAAIHFHKPLNGCIEIPG